MGKKVWEKNEKTQCYEWKGFEHMRNECPNLNKEEENDKKEDKDT